MITRTLFSTACLAAFAIVSLCLPKLSAQTLAPAQSGDQQPPLRMKIDYGEGKERRRLSHHGVMESVGLPLGQTVQITLEFSKKQAGEPVGVSPLDGGEVLVPGGALAVSAEGTATFGFRAFGTTGLYRLMVIGAETYELRFHAFNAGQPTSTAH